MWKTSILVQWVVKGVCFIPVKFLSEKEENVKSLSAKCSMPVNLINVKTWIS